MGSGLVICVCPVSDEQSQGGADQNSGRARAALLLKRQSLDNHGRGVPEKARSQEVQMQCLPSQDKTGDALIWNGKRWVVGARWSHESD